MKAVDFVMTFEEVSSIFDAFEVNLEIVQPYAMEFSSVREAHGFAQAGGVMGAVKAFLKMEADKINAIQVSDLNKKNIGTLRAYAKSGKASRTVHRSDGLRGGVSQDPVLIAAVTGNVSWYKNWLNRRRRIKSRKLP